MIGNGTEERNSVIRYCLVVSALTAVFTFGFGFLFTNSMWFYLATNLPSGWLLGLVNGSLAVLIFILATLSTDKFLRVRKDYRWGLKYFALLPSVMVFEIILDFF